MVKGRWRGVFEGSIVVELGEGGYLLQLSLGGDLGFGVEADSLTLNSVTRRKWSLGNPVLR